jgi:2-polyprenyl-6-methoxyphenol hydroxylase-like FAD-dependent oxidoreductase
MSVRSGEASGSKLTSLDFSFLKDYTKFPFTLLIPQHVTETVFVAAIRERENQNQRELRFIRGIRMVDMRVVPKETAIGRANGFLVTFDDGRRVWCRYLVGADGTTVSFSN